MTCETPAHLLGMTPNPDFTFDAQPERRHMRSLSVGDTPMLQSACLPVALSDDGADIDSLELCDFDLGDIMHDIV